MIRAILSRRLLSVGVFALFVALSLSPASAAPRTSFKIAWSIYVGWMPWPYADESGILKKWADKYGISISTVEINDYVESINQYTAGGYDGVVLTSMDALTIPAAGGVDTTAIIIGDYSNGNDAVILKAADPAHPPGLADLKGRRINLVQLSVSQYLLSRALEAAGLKETDVTLVNTSDADIVSAFTTPDVEAVATWNPQVSEVLKQPNAVKVFDSSKIPGEVLDLLILNTKTLRDNPKLGAALTGAWYEVMSIMTKDDAAGRAARSQMAKDSGSDLPGFDHQLLTTKLFAEPADAVAFGDDPKLKESLDRVRHFSFDHGQFGQGAGSVDAVGIALPDGSILGSPANVKLRFDDSYMKQAANHAL